MEKFVIDLDSILDELEQNDGMSDLSGHYHSPDPSSDVNDRGRPPSLMKIANSNTFGYSNNFGSISSYCDDSGDRSSHQRLNDRIEGPTSSTPSTSASNQYKRHLLSSYMESQTIEKLDSSEAEFGISIKQFETQSNENKDLNNENKSVITTYNIFEDELNNQKSDSEKNELIASLLEKAEWNIENEAHEYDIDTTSTEDDLSEEVLVIEQSEPIDQSMAPQQTSANIEEINDRPTIAAEQTLTENVTDISKCESIDVQLETLKTSVESNEKNQKEDESPKTDNSSNLIDESVEESFGCDSKIELNESEPESNREEKEDNCRDVENEEEIKADVNWESDSLENNFDKTPNVVKFSDIEVNIDHLTELEINEYLSELDDNHSQINDTNDSTNECEINKNIIIENQSQITCDSLKKSY